MHENKINGYLAALPMESGKVLDIELISWFMFGDANKSLEKIYHNSFENFKANHNCSANHKGLFQSL